MRMKSWGAIALLAVLCTAVAVVTTAAYRASQHVPEFYSEMLAIDPQVKTQAAQEMGSRVTMLYNDVRREGKWEALFSTDQINGWLAVDLVEHYSDLLAENVHDPRVQLHDDQVTLAARIDGETFSTVFTLTVEPYLHEPNVLAFRIRKARAGVLPLPMTEVLTEVTLAVEAMDLPLSWTRVDGDPVALITLTPQRDDDNYVRYLETLELHEGEIYVTGRTVPAEKLPGLPTSLMSPVLSRAIKYFAEHPLESFIKPKTPPKTGEAVARASHEQALPPRAKQPPQTKVEAAPRAARSSNAPAQNVTPQR